MDLFRAAAGVAVAVFMMVAPHLGLPYMQAIPVIGGEAPGAEDPAAGGRQMLARLELEVGPRVGLKTLDPDGNRSALRVLWAEVDGAKLDRAGQGQGKLTRVTVAVAAPGALALGNDTLPLRPGDELTIEGFEGKWAYAPDGMVGIVRMEGTVVAARVGEKGLRPLGTQEASVAPGWALSGPGAQNVTVRAGRATFVSTEARAGDDVVKHVRARDVRINGEKVSGTRWGEGPLDTVAFTVAGPGALKGPGGDQPLVEGQRVDVTDFIGAYVVFHAGSGEARVALEGYAASVRMQADAGGPAPASLNQPPVAGFDWSPPRPSAGQAVKFWDRSVDPDGLVVRREWRFGDGRASEEPSPSHAYDDDGTFTVTLTVTDNRLVSTTVSRVITVLNTAPTAAWEANPPRPSRLDRVQFVDGSADRDGRIVAWQWDFGDGAASSDQHPTHQFPRNGRFDVQLTVWDDDGDTATFRKAFEVRNLLPQARFTWAPSAPLSGAAVRFQDATTDPDGRVVAWAWDFGDGATSAERNPLHAFQRKGPHKVTLASTDDDGGSSRWESVVDVRNGPPVADFRVEPEIPTEGHAARFTDLSRDPDGRIVERVWSFGDGSISSQDAPTHTYLAGGNVTVSLTVRDDDGARGTEVRQVQVNRRPVPAFTVSPAAPSTAAPARFTDASVDPDGRVVAWAWAFGDGNGSAERSPEHRYARGGTYTVELTVTDDRGAQATLRRPLNVSNGGPQAAFTWQPRQPSTADDVTFTDASTDPDGQVVRWEWAFGDGTTALGRSVVKRFAQGGAHTVTLVVTDDSGAKATATEAVRVNRAPLAAFTFAPGAPSTSSDVAFTDASTDADGQVVAWSWDFGDGGTSGARHPKHRFAASGVHQVKLTVTDDQGAQGTVVKPVVVGSLAPAAAFTVATASPRAGAPVQFQDASGDADGQVVAWAWDFGDGHRSAAQHPAHTYASPGAYRVKLAVTDNDARTGAAERTVRVFASGPLEVAFRVVYPDLQPVDLTRAGVEVRLHETASGAVLATAGPRPLRVDALGQARGTLEPGEWAPHDAVEVRVRILWAQVDQAEVRALPAAGDLGTIVLRMPLVGRVGLVPPMSPGGAPGVYPDPTEQVRGVVLVEWKDGTPVRGAQVTLAFAWEQLGAYHYPVGSLVGAAGESDGDGRFAFAVPFNAGLPDGPGAYLPGQYRVLARADYVVSDGLATWRAPLTFQEDPGALRSSLRK